MLKVINTALFVYAWGLVIVTLLLFFLMARFYEKKAGQKSYYGGFLLPMLLFFLATMRYTLFTDDPVGDAIGDLLFFIGGAISILMSSFLFRMMTGGRW